MKRRFGMALVTTLVVSTLLLVLGIAFLSFLERDYQFAAVQSRNQEAFYLALSGIEYAKVKPGLLLEADGVTPKPAGITLRIPANNPNRYCVVRLLPNNSLESQGVVQSGLRRVTKTLIVRPGDSPRRFLESGI